MHGKLLLESVPSEQTGHVIPPRAFLEEIGSYLFSVQAFRSCQKNV